MGQRVVRKGRRLKVWVQVSSGMERLETVGLGGGSFLIHLWSQMLCEVRNSLFLRGEPNTGAGNGMNNKN